MSIFISTFSLLHIVGTFFLNFKRHFILYLYFETLIKVCHLMCLWILHIFHFLYFLFLLVFLFDLPLIFILFSMDNIFIALTFPARNMYQKHEEKNALFYHFHFNIIFLLCISIIKWILHLYSLKKKKQKKTEVLIY